MTIVYRALAGAILFLLTGLVSPVSADIRFIDLGDASPATVPGSLVIPGTAEFAAGTEFLDFYGFDLLPAPGVLFSGDGAASSFVTGNPEASFDLTLGFFSWNGAGYELIASDGPAPTVSLDGPIPSSVSQGSLGRQYLLGIGGTVAGGAAGGYNGTLTISAVPEVDSKTALFAGIVLLMVLMSRKIAGVG
jgi:hypothetical protein